MRVFSSRYLVVIGVVFACCIGVVGAVPDDNGVTPIDIGDRLELFVDHHLIDTMNNVELRLHPPHKQSQFSGPKRAYATVLRDRDEYRAYYRDYGPEMRTAVLQSQDGIEWVRPDLGNEADWGIKNAIALELPFAHNFSPFIDKRPNVPDNERFKALAGMHGGSGGLHAFISQDGIHWKKLSDQPVMTYETYAFDSQNVAFWSEAEKKYVAYVRVWVKTDDKDAPQPHPEHGIRTIARSESNDFRTWSKPEPMFYSDTGSTIPSAHLYTNQTQPYFRAPHIYIAFPSRYIAGRVRGQETEDPMLGSTDILFMTSRAGSKRFDLLHREAYIRPGRDPDRWRNRANYVALNVLATSRDEMSIYHSDGSRHVLRTDGFVSVRAGADEGELVTKPLRFVGNELIINYSTSAGGSIYVEIQNAAGEAIPGFRVDDGVCIVGDEIERSVQFEGDLRTLQGQPVRLRFFITDGDLYSFRFQETP